MKKLLASLYDGFLALFGVEPDIDQIISPITSIVTKLDALTVKKSDLSVKAQAEAAKLVAEADAHYEDAQRAARLSTTYGGLLGNS